jgi:nucleotide-binding universal stress UspA family protein/CheY-like chemotaxis protein
MIRRILVPVDGSDHAYKAIEFAAYLAQPEDASIDLLHVVKPVKIPKEIMAYIESEKIEEPPDAFYLKRVGDKIMRAAKEYAKKKGAKRAETFLVEGDPARIILSHADHYDPDIIVMGKRGLDGTQHPGLGNVARQVSRETDLICVTVQKDLLDGKRILIVDDEPDVLETLEEFLSMCEVTKASEFEEAKELLETKQFDLAILDIMGVNGFDLLKIANKQKVVAAMLTAHALTPESTLKSFRDGAASFIPKDHLTNITTYLKDILEAQETGKHFWSRWVERFGSYYNKRFGPGWENRE